MEIASVSTDGWMDKEMWCIIWPLPNSLFVSSYCFPVSCDFNKIHTHTHTHTDMLFNHKKGENPSICDNIDETWGAYAKWNKSEKDKYCMTSLIYWIWKKKKLIETKIRQMVARGRG